MLSTPDAIGQAIERYLLEKEGVQEALPLGAMAMTSDGAQAQLAAATAESKTFFGSCPECNAGQLAFVEGCVKCHICGYSECG